MSTLFAIAASIGTTTALIALVIVARRRLPLVRSLTFVLSLAAVAAGLMVYRATGVRFLLDVHDFFVWLVGTLVTVIVLRLIGLYVFDVYLRIQRNVQLPPLLPSLTLAVAYLIASLLVLRMVYPELDLAPLLATSAVTSLVLGLALQPILGNFFAGVVISFEKPYRINDWINVGGIEGRVVAITWRTTHLRTRDSDDLIIPNAKAADEHVLNYLYPNPLHLLRVTVSAHYAAPPYRVTRALLECVPEVSGVLEKPTPDVQVKNFADSSITYELRVWIDDMVAADRIRSDLRSKIWESFARHGLAFPFPTRTLEIAPRARPRQAADAGTLRPGRLFMAEGPHAGVTFNLLDGPTTIGRGAGSHIQLSEGSISKEHARIDRTPEGYVLVDLQSDSGTFVNGSRVDRHLLAPFDRLTVGTSVFCFEEDDR